MQVNQCSYETILNTLVVRMFVLRIYLNAVKRLSAYLVNSSLVTINKRKFCNMQNKSEEKFRTEGFLRIKFLSFINAWLEIIQVHNTVYKLGPKICP